MNHTNVEGDEMRAGAQQLIAVDLSTLAAQANEAYRQSLRAGQSMVAYAIQAGQHLAEAKRHVPHGEWATWLRTHFEASARTAQDYMRLASLKPQHAADLPGYASVREALEALRPPSRLAVSGPEDDAVDKWDADMRAIEEELRALDARRSCVAITEGEVGLRTLKQIMDRAGVIARDAERLHGIAVERLGRCINELSTLTGITAEDIHGDMLEAIGHAAEERLAELAYPA